ncbi:hypothetical protein HK096_001674, partial [Nowakowskiella sp. JEL0078]
MKKSRISEWNSSLARKNNSISKVRSVRFFALSLLFLFLALAVAIAHLVLLIAVPSFPINLSSIELIIDFLTSKALPSTKLYSYVFCGTVIVWYIIFLILLVRPLSKKKSRFTILIILNFIHVLGLIASVFTSVAASVYVNTNSQYYNFNTIHIIIFALTEVLYFLTGVIFATCVFIYLISHGREQNEINKKEVEELRLITSPSPESQVTVSPVLKKVVDPNELPPSVVPYSIVGTDMTIRAS